MILHISDLHFDSVSNIKLIDKMLDSIDEHQLTISYLVMSGDFLFRGTCPNFSNKAIKKIISKLNLDKNKVITCPGNHDLDIKNSRLNSEYLNLMMDIYDNDTRFFINNGESSKIHDFPEDNVCFIAVNSCYHLDHTTGKVDINSFITKMEQVEEKRKKIVVVHHHLIPYNQNDMSHICNAYEFLKVVDFHNVNLILHGHRHCELDISVGKSQIVGVGSFLFPNSPNLNNQFNVYNGLKLEKRFRYLFDKSSPKDGSLGYWMCN